MIGIKKHIERMTSATGILKTCLTFLAFIVAVQMYAQTYALPDTNLRNALLKKHPYLMTGNELNISAANGYIGGLDLDSANIVNAAGIEFFTNNRTLNLNYNKLTSIPQIANLSSLEILFLEGNELTSLPSFTNLVNLKELHLQYNKLTTLPSLSALTNLKRFYFNDNKITIIPNISSLVNLEIIIGSNNPLGTAPDFSSLVNLKQLHLNQTGIDTLIGLSSLVNLEMLHCWGNNLRSISGLNSGNKLFMLLVQDNPLKKLPSLAPFTNLRSLHVNNTGIDTIRGLSSLFWLNELHCSGNTIRSLSGINGLTYLTTIVAKDNLLEQLPTLTNKPGLNLVNVKRNKITFEDLLPLSTQPSFNTVYAYEPQLPIGKEITYTVRKNESLQLDANIDPAVTTNWYKWYKNGILLDSNQSGIKNLSPVDFTDAGIYSVVVNNPGIPGLTLTSYNWTVKVLDCEGCSAIFSPDGDGIMDTYKIQESGIARIYNVSGNLIKELAVPAEWDGTNLNGILTDAGYYAIVINGRKVINVSLMR